MSAPLKLPAGFRPQNIGKVVTIQVFNTKNGDVLPDTLRKYVGRLQYYVFQDDDILWQFEGGVLMRHSRTLHIELIEHNSHTTALRMKEPK